MHWIILFASVLFAFAANAVDTDGDGIPDSLDTCINDTRNVSPAGCDHDFDGYGNVCDGDFDQNFTTNSVDFGTYFTPAFKGGDPSPWPEGMDMDCNGTVNSADFGTYFTPAFKSHPAPGDSGVGCQGFSLCKPNMEARAVEYELGGSGVDLTTQIGGKFVTQSEPLHPSIAPSAGSADPDDSEAYGGQSVREATQVQLGDPVLVSDVTAGLPFAFATNVVKSKGTAVTNSGDWAFVKTANQGVSDQSVCNRLYFNYSSGFANGSNSATDVVLAEAVSQGTASPQIRIFWNSGVATLTKGVGSTNFGGSGNTAFTGSGVTRSECSGEWCRFELCFDHDEQLDGTNKVRIRSEIEIVTGANAGQIDSVDETLPNASGTLGPQVSMGLLFTGSSSSWWDSTQYLYLSNAISTQWNSVDITYKNGSAYEIEGF